jgi:hypothetical protein
MCVTANEYSDMDLHHIFRPLRQQWQHHQHPGAFSMDRIDGLEFSTFPGFIVVDAKKTQNSGPRNISKQVWTIPIGKFSRWPRGRADMI